MKIGQLVKHTAANCERLVENDNFNKFNVGIILGSTISGYTKVYWIINYFVGYNHNISYHSDY